MKRAALIVAALLALFTLTACESGADDRKNEYHFCVEHGGTFSTHDVDFKCVLPVSR